VTAAAARQPVSIEYAHHRYHLQRIET